MMTKEKANKIYDLLVSIGGAYEPERDSFIYHHTKSKGGCDEWRFSGKLGFSGKYRSGYNKVDCYREDETPERIKLMNVLNDALANLDLSDARRSVLVTPDNYWGMEEWYMPVIECPKCKHKVPAKFSNYCSGCGVKLKLSTTVQKYIDNAD